MVDLLENYRPLLVTQRDVGEAHPKWSQSGITDYLNKYSDFISLSETTGEVIDNVTSIDARLTIVEGKVEALEFKCIVDTELSAGATELTTTRNERIVCNNTSPGIVTLNVTPTDQEEVIIWNRSSSVTVVGPINGDVQLVVWGRYDAPRLRYSVLTGEWGLL